MSKIYTYKKGSDDFAKSKAYDELYSFEVFSKIEVSDILIFFYPDTKSLGIYSCIKLEGMFKSPDLVSTKGLMRRIDGENPEKFLEDLHGRDFDAFTTIKEIILNLIK